MTDINKLNQRLKQIEVEKQEIKNKLLKTSRTNATSRKIELGVHLLKLAETDITIHTALSKVWAVAKAKRPNAFIDVELPAAPKTIKFNSDISK
jgi:hypothetical protein